MLVSFRLEDGESRELTGIAFLRSNVGALQMHKAPRRPRPGLLVGPS